MSWDMSTMQFEIPACHSHVKEGSMFIIASNFRMNEVACRHRTASHCSISRFEVPDRPHNERPVNVAWGGLWSIENERAVKTEKKRLARILSCERGVYKLNKFHNGSASRGADPILQLVHVLVGKPTILGQALQRVTVDSTGFYALYWRSG